MTTFDRIQSISSNIDKETANALAKAYWEIRNQRLTLEVFRSNLIDHTTSDDELLAHFQKVILEVEKSIDPTLESYSKNTTVGRWALAQLGIGPVTTARLLSHIDIDRSRTPEHLWSYAGLAPKQSGKVRTSYNNSLKEVCIDLGKNFVKYSSRDKSFYGNLYLDERKRRIKLNEQGEYADLAQEALANPNIKDKTWEADKLVYETGKIPQDRIDAQAQRYAVKIFLAHWHAVAYRESFGVEYVSHHKNLIPVPEWPF